MQPMCICSSMQRSAQRQCHSAEAGVAQQQLLLPLRTLFPHLELAEMKLTPAQVRMRPVHIGMTVDHGGQHRQRCRVVAPHERQ